MRSVRCVLALAVGCLAIGCGPGCASNEPLPEVLAPPPLPPPAAASAIPPAPAPVDRFAPLWKEFLGDYLRREPVEATTLGSHDHDGEWPDLSAAARDDDQRFWSRTRDALAALGEADVPAASRLDREILANKLDTLAFLHAEIRPEETDPHYYSELLGAGLDAFITRDFAPASERAASLARRLAGIARVVAVARARLSHPSRIATETAIRQTKGLVALVDGGFPELLAQAPAQKAAVAEARVPASRALHELLAFLEKDLLPRSDGSFRVGDAKLRRILALTLDKDVDADELVRSARATLAEAKDDMALTATELWPEVMGSAPRPDATTPAGKKALVRKVLDRLAEDHPTNATVIGDATKLLAQATDFVKTKDLVSVPDQPCKVMELPEYRRGVAIAYCDWAGPLETKAETHVSLSPTPADWPRARALSFYREYDESMLADLMVHEAMPGHFLQGAHMAASRAAPRAVFANDAFVEGWAVYAEWLMAKRGFGGARVRIQREKMLARVAVNAILDHEIHAGTMDEKAALDLMEGDAFQEEGEAVGKWTRARVSHGQLSQYLYGFLELMKIRSVAEKLPGFAEHAFHDEVLSFGAPSVHELRREVHAETPR